MPVGCATEEEPQAQEEPQQEQVEQPEENPNTAIAQENPDNNIAAENTESEQVEQPVTDRPAETIAQSSPEAIAIDNVIYFDFDSANLTEEAKAKLRQISQQLQDGDRTITIEGHADERGSHDYNINLGHRRAEAVQEYLVTLGVDRTNLSTLSHGETRPMVEDSNPQAWSQNRRVEFRP